MIIHFKKPRHWPDAYLYHWNTTPWAESPAWPGAKMDPEHGDWYRLELPGQETADLVFNDGAGSQTVDLRWRLAEGWCVAGELWDTDPDRLRHFAFPGGKLKALVLSFDDGSEQDRRLIERLDAHGLKGTFHINSGLTEGPGKVHAADIATVYAGHEVSGHSTTHPFLDSLAEERLESEILGDIRALERWVGYPVRGLAYPFGVSHPALERLLPEWGLIYGRLVGDTHDFRLPGNPLLWRPSGHQTQALELSRRFLALAPEEPSLLCVWGHSWEINDHQPGNNWGYIEEFCAVMGRRTDIWYAGAGEVAEYLGAMRAVRFSADGHRVYNPSALPVFLRQGGGIVELAPGKTFDLAP